MKAGRRAIIAHLATKADVADVRATVGQIGADVAAVETAIIKWIVATVLASAALAFAISALSNPFAPSSGGRGCNEHPPGVNRPKIH
jgi:hypothetical protein